MTTTHHHEHSCGIGKKTGNTKDLEEEIQGYDFGRVVTVMVDRDSNIEVLV